MTELAALNVRITGDNGDLTAALTSARNQLETFGNAAGQAGQVTRPLAGAMGRVGQAMNGARGQIQNVAFQLQDMAVQLQGGTAASIVFAQQGSQIASAFGPVGAVIGALAAVGIPALAFAFGSASNGAQQFQDALSALDDQVSELNELLGSVTVENYDEMIERYGVLNQAVHENIAAMTSLNAQLISMASVDLGGLFSESFGGMLTSRVDEMRIAFETTNDQARQLLILMDNVAQSRGPDELIQSMTVLRDELIATAGGIDNLTVEQAQFVLEIGKAIDRANMARGALQSMVAPVERVNVVAMQLAPILDSARAAADRAAGAVAGIGTAADGAVGAVSNLAAKMWDMAQARIAANNALEAIAFENSPAGQAMNRYGGRGTTSNRPVTMGTGEIVNFAGSDTGAGVGSGSGAGDAESPWAAELEALQQSLMTQEQLQAESFARQQEVLNQALQDRLISQQEYAALMEQVEATHQAAMQSELNDGISGTLNALGQLFQGSKKIGAAVALANSWLAFTEVLKDPAYVGRPWARIAAAGQALAAGLNAVRNIKSAQPGGAGGGGGVGGSMGGAGGAGGAAAQSPVTTFQFTLTNDPFGFGENFARQFIDQLNATQRNGGQIRGVIA